MSKDPAEYLGASLSPADSSPKTIRFTDCTGGVDDGPGKRLPIGRRPAHDLAVNGPNGGSTYTASDSLDGLIASGSA